MGDEPTQSILFLCVANSARSQIAEGVARTKLGERFLIRSAGSEPTQINPYAVRVMEEIGIDISRQRSKSVATIDPKDVAVVITLCDEEVCPVFLGEARRIHWPLKDPARSPELEDEAQLKRFRDTRDTLVAKIGALRI
ncbi:MAG: arsenate reductase ArsC [Myxococcota bacterium]